MMTSLDVDLGRGRSSSSVKLTETPIVRRHGDGTNKGGRIWTAPAGCVEFSAHPQRERGQRHHDYNRIVSRHQTTCARRFGYDVSLAADVSSTFAT